MYVMECPSSVNKNLMQFSSLKNTLIIQSRKVVIGYIN